MALNISCLVFAFLCCPFMDVFRAEHGRVLNWKGLLLPPLLVWKHRTVEKRAAWLQPSVVKAEAVPAGAIRPAVSCLPVLCVSGPLLPPPPPPRSWRGRRGCRARDLPQPAPVHQAQAGAVTGVSSLALEGGPGVWCWGLSAWTRDPRW